MSQLKWPSYNASIDVNELSDFQSWNQPQLTAIT